MDKSSLVPHSSNSNGATPAAAPGLSNGAAEALAAFNDTSLAAEWRGGENYNSNGSSSRYGEENESGFDLQQILSILRRRWPIMAATFLVSIGLGIFLNLIAKPIYQASAMMEVDTDSRQDLSSDLPGLSDFVDSKQSRSIDTQIEILRGPPILAAAKKRVSLDLRRKAGGYAPVTIAQVNGSNLINVAVQSYNPDSAAALANAVCQQYIDMSLQKNRNNSLGAVKYVQDQIDTVQKDLQKKQNDLKKFKQRTGIFSISDQATALAGNLTQAQTALQQVQADRASTAAQLTGMQSQVASIPSSRVVPDGIQRNPEVDALQTQLTQLEIDRDSAAKEYAPTSFKIKGLDAQIRVVRDRLNSSARTIVAGWKPDPVREPLLQNIAATQSLLWATDAKVNALTQQVAKAKGTLSQLPEQEFEFTQLTTDVTVLQQSYQLLIGKLQSLNIGAEGQSADARLVFSAQPNHSPVAPDKRKTLLYSILLGAMAALALAMLMDALDNRIYNDSDATRATSLPVLAHIPFIKTTAEQSLAFTGDKVTPLLESFRMLRANIAFSAADKPIKAVVVTSSVPNEGKSNSALNLAIATALGGERTILIDLDLRRPTQHKLSNLANAVGFTNVISGQATLEEALQDTATPGLRVLTSGPVPPNPFRLLNSQNARQTILKVIENADFVVVDTPPMLGLADARLISSLVDGTLMVISCQETGRREASRAADLLLQTNNEVLGTVLTKVPSGNDAYGYYQYQHYGRYFEDNDTPTDDLADTDLPTLDKSNAGKSKK